MLKTSHDFHLVFHINNRQTSNTLFLVSKQNAENPVVKRTEISSSNKTVGSLVNGTIASNVTTGKQHFLCPGFSVCNLRVRKV